MKERRGSDMRQEDNDISPVKKLETRFMLVEKRIRALLDENGTLAARVSELERELAQAKNDAPATAGIPGKDDAYPQEGRECPSDPRVDRFREKTGLSNPLVRIFFVIPVPI